MRKALIGAVAIPLTLGLLMPTSASGIDVVNTKKIRTAVTVNGILQHERAFQRIANDNGGTRASGTPGLRRLGDYVAQQLRQAGYKRDGPGVHLPVLPELWRRRSSRKLTPTPTTTRPATFEYSGSGDVTGAIVPTNDIVIPPTPGAQQHVWLRSRRTSRPRRPNRRSR